nr:hypothetical protein [Gammaproteobacteria bacterium]
MSDAAVLSCQGMGRRFTTGPSDVVVLDGVDFTLAAGEQVAIVKSTPSSTTTSLGPVVKRLPIPWHDSTAASLIAQ